MLTQAEIEDALNALAEVRKEMAGLHEEVSVLRAESSVLRAESSVLQARLAAARKDVDVAEWRGYMLALGEVAGLIEAERVEHQASVDAYNRHPPEHEGRLMAMLEVQTSLEQVVALGEAVRKLAVERGRP
jgi:phage shock protein A